MMQVGCRPPKNEMKSGAKIRPVVRVRIISFRLKIAHLKASPRGEAVTAVAVTDEVPFMLKTIINTSSVIC